MPSAVNVYPGPHACMVSQTLRHIAQVKSIVYSDTHKYIPHIVTKTSEESSKYFGQIDKHFLAFCGILVKVLLNIFRSHVHTTHNFTDKYIYILNNSK
jgi:hypothetical protein